MRPLHVIVALLGVLVALGIFLVYGGQRAIDPSPRQSRGALETPVEPPRSDPNVRAELDALSERIDALADELGRMRKSSERVELPPLQANTVDAEFTPAQREVVLRLIAADRDRLTVKAQTKALMHEIINYVVASNPPLDSRNPKLAIDFPIQAVVDVLVDARVRYGEIRGRFVPLDQEPDSEGPWRPAFDKEVAALRDWRRSKLIQLVGASAAEECATVSYSVFQF